MIFTRPDDVVKTIENKGIFYVWHAARTEIPGAGDLCNLHYECVRTTDGRGFLLEMQPHATYGFTIDLKSQPFRNSCPSTYSMPPSCELLDDYLTSMTSAWELIPSAFLDIGAICKQRGWYVLSPEYVGFKPKRKANQMIVKRNKNEPAEKICIFTPRSPDGDEWKLINCVWNVFGPQSLKTPADVNAACDNLEATFWKS